VQIQLRLLSFPGWKIYANDREWPVSIGGGGEMQFSLPGGVFTVKAIFENTPIRSIGTVSTVFSLGIFGIALVLPRRVWNFFKKTRDWG
jgi:hypothetical protein